MVPDKDIVDMEGHILQASARGYRVVSSETGGRWTLLSPTHDYRGTFDTVELAWRAAPKDRRSKPRPALDAAA